MICAHVLAYHFMSLISGGVLCTMIWFSKIIDCYFQVKKPSIEHNMDHRDALCQSKTYTKACY